MKEKTEFTKNVIKFIKNIPKGRVATYGQIATLAGKPQGARGVVWILSSSGKKESLPWQRVVGAKGRIAFPKGSSKAKRQSRMLREESVQVIEGFVDLELFGWKKKPPKPKAGRLVPRMFS